MEVDRGILFAAEIITVKDWTFIDGKLYLYQEGAKAEEIKRGLSNISREKNEIVNPIKRADITKNGEPFDMKPGWVRYYDEKTNGAQFKVNVNISGLNQRGDDMKVVPYTNTTMFKGIKSDSISPGKVYLCGRVSSVDGGTKDNYLYSDKLFSDNKVSGNKFEIEHGCKKVLFA